jgi:hypothetical protein
MIEEAHVKSPKPSEKDEALENPIAPAATIKSKLNINVIDGQYN